MIQCLLYDTHSFCFNKFSPLLYTIKCGFETSQISRPAFPQTHPGSLCASCFSKSTAWMREGGDVFSNSPLCQRAKFPYTSVNTAHLFTPKPPSLPQAIITIAELSGWMNSTLCRRERVENVDKWSCRGGAAWQHHGNWHRRELALEVFVQALRKLTCR